MRWQKRLAGMIGAAALVVGSGIAPASATLTLDWHTVDGGGHTFSAYGNLALGGTAGQPDAGTVSNGALELKGGFWVGGGAVSSVPAAPGSQEEALVFRVRAGFPNPFSGATRIGLELPDPAPVRIQVFDPSGRLVRGICDQTLPAGRHLLAWSGRDDAGHRAASGVYLLRVRAGDHLVKRRLVLLK